MSQITAAAGLIMRHGGNDQSYLVGIARVHHHHPHVGPRRARGTHLGTARLGRQGDPLDARRPARAAWTVNHLAQALHHRLTPDRVHRQVHRLPRFVGEQPRPHPLARGNRVGHHGSLQRGGAGIRLPDGEEARVDRPPDLLVKARVVLALPVGAIYHARDAARVQGRRRHPGWRQPFAGQLPQSGRLHHGVEALPADPLRHLQEVGIARHPQGLVQVHGTMPGLAVAAYRGVAAVEHSPGALERGFRGDETRLQRRQSNQRFDRRSRGCSICQATVCIRHSLALQGFLPDAVLGIQSQGRCALGRVGQGQDVAIVAHHHQTTAHAGQRFLGPLLDVHVKGQRDRAPSHRVCLTQRALTEEHRIQKQPFDPRLTAELGIAPALGPEPASHRQVGEVAVGGQLATAAPGEIGAAAGQRRQVGQVVDALRQAHQVHRRVAGARQQPALQRLAIEVAPEDQGHRGGPQQVRLDGLARHTFDLCLAGPEIDSQARHLLFDQIQGLAARRADVADGGWLDGEGILIDRHIQGCAIAITHRRPVGPHRGDADGVIFEGLARRFLVAGLVPVRPEQAADPAQHQTAEDQALETRIAIRRYVVRHHAPLLAWRRTAPSRRRATARAPAVIAVNNTDSRMVAPAR